MIDTDSAIDTDSDSNVSHSLPQIKVWRLARASLDFNLRSFCDQPPEQN